MSRSLKRYLWVCIIRSNNTGFTLIELLVVITIVGLLSAIAIPTFLSQVERARVVEAQTRLYEISRGATLYQFDNGVYPTLDQLAATNIISEGFTGAGISGNYDYVEFGLLDSEEATYRAIGQGSASGLVCQIGVGNAITNTNLGLSSAGERPCQYGT